MLHSAQLLILSIDVQEGLEPAVVLRRNGAHFSQCNMAWGGFPCARGSGCHSFILVDAVFLIDGGRRRKE
jgi:hypothetical protein